MHIYYVSINTNQTTSIDYETSQNLEVLKGDIAYLKAILSRVFDDESNNNGEPTPQRTINSVSQLVFMLPLKIKFFIPQIIDKKLLIIGKSNLSVIYLKIPSPPPKIFS